MIYSELDVANMQFSSFQCLTKEVHPACKNSYQKSPKFFFYYYYYYYYYKVSYIKYRNVQESKAQTTNEKALGEDANTARWL